MTKHELQIGAIGERSANLLYEMRFKSRHVRQHAVRGDRMQMRVQIVGDAGRIQRKHDQIALREKRVGIARALLDRAVVRSRLQRLRIAVHAQYAISQRGKRLSVRAADDAESDDGYGMEFTHDRTPSNAAPPARTLRFRVR